MFCLPKTAWPPTSQAPKSTGCCPPVDTSQFQEREFTWDKKLFLREHVRTFFHVPLNMNGRMKHAMEMIEGAHAKADHPLMLADEASPWRSELFIDVAKPVPGAEMSTLSGTFMTKVYDGPFNRVPQWMQEVGS